MTGGVPTIDKVEPQWVSLCAFRNTGYTPGRSRPVRALWYVVSLVIFESGLFPLYGIKRWLLRRFGASVGPGVVIKPRVRIKFPWKLRIGSQSWIGQEVWIDNLAPVTLGQDVCISQGTYVCTGSHDHRRLTFDLIVKPIIIERAAWIAARAVVLPGVTIGCGAVVAAASVVTRDVPPGVIVAGSPCRVIGERVPTDEA